MDCPSNIQSLFKSRWPSLTLEWNKATKGFDIWERYVKGAVYDSRYLMPYTNYDGARLPVIADRVIELVQKADVRLWPLAERIAVMRKEREDSKEAAKRAFRHQTQARITEDWNYINGTKTHFMDPTSMPVRRTTYTPYQEAELRRMGEL